MAIDRLRSSQMASEEKQASQVRSPSFSREQFEVGLELLEVEVEVDEEEEGEGESQSLGCGDRVDSFVVAGFL